MQKCDLCGDNAALTIEFEDEDDSLQAYCYVCKPTVIDLESGMEI